MLPAIGIASHQVIVSPAILDRDVFAFHESSVIQALPEGIDDECKTRSRCTSHKPDHRRRRLLPAAASGHTAAAPPSSKMKARRFN
jgi:hypothetical protein